MSRRPVLVLCSLALASASARAQNLIYDLTEPGGDQPVGSCGDLNGDGVPDFLVGAPSDHTLINNAGKVTVRSGKDGSLLYTFLGQFEHEQLGFALDGAGDVNADGFPDVIGGDGKTLQGRARLWSGATGAQLWEDTAGAYDFFGNAVTGVGDADFDGYDDFAVAAPQDEAFHPGPGFVRVYSGQTKGLMATLVGDCAFAEFGVSIDGLGDVNADGLVELAVYADSAIGSCPGTVKVFALPGGLLHTLPCDGPITLGPYGVAAAGDLDGDGLGDVVVGNSGPNFCSGSSPGNVKAYSGLSGALLLDVDGDPGCTWLGWAVDGVGDLDGDGRDDVAVGAAGTDRVDVYSGLDQSLLLRIESPSGGNYGYGVAGLGDLDGDGSVEIAGSGVGPGAWVHSSCPGTVAPYGSGCAGSGSFVPKLAATGCPNPGQTLMLHVTGGFGGQPAFLAFGTGAGSVPLAGACNLLVAPWLFTASIGPLLGAGAGLGHLDVPIKVPPGTSGLTVTVQEANIDPPTPARFAVSNGLRIELE